MKKYIFLSLFIYSITILTACKNKKSQTINVNQPISIKLSLADSIKIHYNITSETNLQEEINDEKVNNINRVETEVEYNVKKDSTNGAYDLLMRYDQFKVYIKQGDTEKNFDATMASSDSNDPGERIFSAFKDLTINAILTSDGKVKSISGIDVLSNKIYALAGNDQRTIAAIQSFVKSYASNAFFKDNIEHNFKIYPAHPVTEGDVWTLNDTLQSGIKIPITATYKLESVDEGIATISVSTDIKTDDQPIETMGYSATANINGSEDGEIKVDIATGLLISDETTLKIDGKIEMAGTIIPITVKTKSAIIKK